MTANANRQSDGESEQFWVVVQFEHSRVDADKIGAKIEQGLVTLTLPTAEHVKPRKIAVS